MDENANDVKSMLQAREKEKTTETKYQQAVVGANGLLKRSAQPLLSLSRFSVQSLSRRSQDAMNSTSFAVFTADE